MLGSFGNSSQSPKKGEVLISGPRNAATGMYAEWMQRNKLMEAAENIGLPTFVVADAARTQVLFGSKTVLAVGPGPKESVDSVRNSASKPTT